MLASGPVFGQIDPERRQLVQLGYNQALVGRGPISGYAFYYRNDPDFMRTNITLRLAVAPVYLDSEVGFRHALGENTDLGVGVSGGGFAESYFEMRSGQYRRDESFTGHGGEVSASVYHLFDPSFRVPLTGVLRVAPHYSVYDRDDQTSPKFTLPEDHGSLRVRGGLRFGGEEPLLAPDVAMELSTWYEAQVRQHPGSYGFDDDREMNTVTHMYWARALFVYTLPKSKQAINVSLTAGGSIDGDRFSAYRLGGDLPLSSEFPLIMPGYYYQEISARQFVNFTGSYSVPLDSAKRWRITGIGSVAGVQYTHGLEQAGHTHSGAGLGLEYRSVSGVWNVLAGYGYGFQAIRSDGRGGQSIGFLCQIDLEAQRRQGPWFNERASTISRGLSRILGNWF